MGLNDHGLVAVVMNREGSLGPDPVKLSRGELVLKALEFAKAEQAVRALALLSADSYRPFNLFVGDSHRAFWLRNRDIPGACGIEVFDVDVGLHLLSAGELDDLSHPRTGVYLPRFQDAATPDPDSGNWDDWIALLRSRFYPQGLGPKAAMNLDMPSGFGTVSSSLIALPSRRRVRSGRKHQWWYAQGSPDKTSFSPVAL